MTTIKLIVTGAKASAEVDGVLTSGAVGIPVIIECDDAWDGLTKNLVCTSGKWAPDGKAATILNVLDSATVASEVMIGEDRLYLGIEGYNADGTQVIPTTWADCGYICPGATINAAPAAKPTLPIWAQLQRQIEELKENGSVDGVSPTVEVSKSGKVTTVTITDADGTKTATINDGNDGAMGAAGAAGADGADYVLTGADMSEIAEMVENATIIQAPKYVNSVEEMTDTDRPYVLIETGHIWANAETTVVATKTESAGMPVFDNSRLGSDGSTATDATAYAGYVATDYIDLLAYPIPFQLHIDGGIFLPASADSYTRMGTYTAAKAKINVLQQIQNGIDQILNVPDSDVTVDSSNNITITFNQTPKTNNANNDGVLQYVRFSGKGEPDTVNVYVTYEAETAGVQWFDTGTTYAAVLTDADKEEIAAEVAELVDAQLLDLIGDGAVTV